MPACPACSVSDGAHGMQHCSERPLPHHVHIPAVHKACKASHVQQMQPMTQYQQQQQRHSLPQPAAFQRSPPKSSPRASAAQQLSATGQRIVREQLQEWHTAQVAVVDDQRAVLHVTSHGACSGQCTCRHAHRSMLCTQGLCQGRVAAAQATRHAARGLSSGGLQHWQHQRVHMWQCSGIALVYKSGNLAKLRLTAGLVPILREGIVAAKQPSHQPVNMPCQGGLMCYESMMQGSFGSCAARYAQPVARQMLGIANSHLHAKEAWCACRTMHFS